MTAARIWWSNKRSQLLCQVPVYPLKSQSPFYSSPPRLRKHFGTVGCNSVDSPGEADVAKIHRLSKGSYLSILKWENDWDVIQFNFVPVQKNARKKTQARHSQHAANAACPVGMKRRRDTCLFPLIHHIYRDIAFRWYICHPCPSMPVGTGPSQIYLHILMITKAISSFASGPQEKRIVASSYHNYQGCRSYKTPDEVGVKSKPTSVMGKQEKKVFRARARGIYQRWASDREKWELYNIPLGGRKYYTACSFESWIIRWVSDSAIDGVR